MSTSPIGVNTTGVTTSNTSSSTSQPLNNTVNENEFLQLLVAQLQYQDPSQPADGTQFVTELAQFTDVSNTTDMAGDLDTITQIMQSNASAMSAAPASGTQNTSNTSGSTPQAESGGSLSNPVVNS